MKSRLRSIFICFSVLILSTSGVLTIMSQSSSAEPLTFSKMKTDERIASYAFYNGLVKCVNDGHYNKTANTLDDVFLNQQSIVDVGLFAETVASKSTAVSLGDGKMYCQTIAKAAFKLWGLYDIDTATILNAIGYFKPSGKAYECSFYNGNNNNEVVSFGSMTGAGETFSFNSIVLPFTLPEEYANNMTYSPAMNNAVGDNETLDNTDELTVFCEQVVSNFYGYSFNAVSETSATATLYTLDSLTLLTYLETSVFEITNYRNDSPSLNDAYMYYLYKYYFQASDVCGAKSYGPTSALTDSVDDLNIKNGTVDNTGNKYQYVTVNILEDSSGKTSEYSFLMQGKKAISGEGFLALNSTGTTCSDVAAQLGAYSSKVASILGKPSDANYPIYKTIVDDAGGASTIPTGNVINDTTNSDNSDEKATCGSTVTGIGWIVCPIINGLVALNDGAWQIVQGLLIVNPLSQTGNYNYIYQAWGIIRNIANIAFVIVFLIVIFSQTTGFGIQNYGIKKLLPKIIVGAILVNLSFLIMQISVDLANIVGKSLYSLILGAVPGIPTSLGWSAVVDKITLALGAGLAVGGVSLAGGSAAAFLLLLPALAMAALTLLAALFTLMLRQAAIPILVILAPLAFVAYLLPNTESWFKKWKKILIDALLLYPLAAVVFSGARFAAVIITGDGSDWFRSMMGMIVLVLPLGSLPFIASKGGMLTDAAFKGMKNTFGKLKNPISDFSKPRAELAKARYLSGEGRTRFGRSAVGGFARRSAQTRAFRQKELKLNTDTANKNFDSMFENSDRGKIARDSSNLADVQANIDKSNTGTRMQSSIVGRSAIINEKAAEAKLKAAQATNTRLVSEATTATSAGVNNLVANGIDRADAARIAAGLHNAQRTVDIETGASNSATNIYKQKLNDDIVTMPRLANELGGIDPYGRARAVASARANVEQVRNANISSEISNLRSEQYSGNSKSGDSELVKVLKSNMLKDGSTPATVEQRNAAMRLAVQSGDYKNQKAVADYLGDSTNGLSPEERLVLQQDYFNEMAKSSKIKSLSGGDKGAMQEGKYTGTISDKLMTYFTSDKISPDMFQQIDKDELEDFVINILPSSSLLTDPTQLAKRKALLQVTSTAKRDPKIYNSLSDGVKGFMDTLISTL